MRLDPPYVGLADATLTTSSNANANVYTWTMSNKTLNPGEEIIAKLTTKVLSAVPNEIKNIVSVSTPSGEATGSNNNRTEYIISKQ